MCSAGLPGWNVESHLGSAQRHWAAVWRRCVRTTSDTPSVQESLPTADPTHPARTHRHDCLIKPALIPPPRSAAGRPNISPEGPFLQNPLLKETVDLLKTLI